MNMFGHLKAEDFTNLLEGASLPERRQAHLQTCARCMEKLESVQEIRKHITTAPMENDEYIPEPDWSEFRSDVRNALLSRSVRRENAARGWLGGLRWQPAMAWGVSMLLVVGLTTIIWNHQTDLSRPPVVAVENPTTEEDNISSLATVAQTDVFDDLLSLNPDEAKSLQMILDNMAQEGVSQQ